jgi:NAD(P)-dependent dehydrogenase (short-subunit alcohol dehydrogenase family)
MTHAGWGPGVIPPQAGRLAVVTGGSGGLGYEIALGLAQECADVILAGRNEARGRAAAGKIRALAPNALVRYERLDLADLASVDAFAARLTAGGRAVDLLINNAGVMALPNRQLTADGFEMQLGVNYLGHFALTARLLPLLRLSRYARVVQMSSLAHRWGRIRLDDLNSEREYRPWVAYCQSKLAIVLFARELQRRSSEGDWGLLSCAVHPGYAQTELFSNGPGKLSAASLLSGSVGRVLSHSAAEGAQAALFAATSMDVAPGGFYGPVGAMGLTGEPGVAAISKRGMDEVMGRNLWGEAEKMTGVVWAEG